MSRTVIVVAGGPDSPEAPELPPHVAVVAADGGAVRARMLGLRIDLVVGDLDSLPPEVAQSIEAAGVPFERHDRDKDKTDFELALEAALRFEPDRILVIGSSSGRLDQLVGQLAVLASEALAGIEVDALLGPATVHVVRGRRVLEGEPGELISLHALHGDAFGVSTEGLRFPLHAETLPAATSRGVSNEFAADRAEISLTGGVVLAVRPGFS